MLANNKSFRDLVEISEIVRDFLPHILLLYQHIIFRLLDSSNIEPAVIETLSFIILALRDTVLCPDLFGLTHEELIEHTPLVTYI